MTIPFYAAVLFGCMTALIGYLCGASHGTVRYRKTVGDIEMEFEATSVRELEQLRTLFVERRPEISREK
jgi:hypothetical protein